MIPAFCLLFAFLAHVTKASHFPTVGGHKTRRLEDEANNNDDAGNSEMTFLSDYCQKILSCQTPDKPWKEEDDSGPRQPYVIVYRMCYECLGTDNAASCETCNEGFGDYVIGLNSFLEVYFETYKPYGVNNGENQFDYSDYAYCTKYHQDDDGNKYYVGPTCTSDETGVRLGLFVDKHCTVASDYVSFEDIAGYELPYSDGGLVITSDLVDSGCNLIPCSTQCNDDDNCEAVNPYCTTMYESSGKCERNMATTDSSGQHQTDSCGYIDKLVPHFSLRMGKSIDLIILFLFISGVIGYVVYQKQKRRRKKREAKMEGVNNDGLISGTTQH